MTDTNLMNQKAGAVADSLAAFRALPGARVAVRQIKYKPSGGVPKQAVLVVLSVDHKDFDLITNGGLLDFAISPAGSSE